MWVAVSVTLSVLSSFDHAGDFRARSLVEVSVWEIVSGGVSSLVSTLTFSRHCESLSFSARETALIVSLSSRRKKSIRYRLDNYPLDHKEKNGNPVRRRIFGVPSKSNAARRRCGLVVAHDRLRRLQANPQKNLSPTV